MKNILAGLLFAALWGSGSVATKFGLRSAQPLLLINTRFLLAALLMLGISLLYHKDRMPKRTEWLPLMACGILSMAIYPSAFVYAMKQVTAGIGTLGSAACPLIISFLNAVFLRRTITWPIWAGLALGVGGVAIAIYPLLQNAHATPLGVALMSFSMLAYSIATVYYQSVPWTLPRLSINGWQVLFGGLVLLPFTGYTFVPDANRYDGIFWGAVFWLVVPISIFAVQIWLYLLKAEPTKAALWLFLCPIFGFFLANWILQEPITLYTGVGTLLVIAGLYLGQNNG